MMYRNRGFTLIELMISVAIIGLLSAIALPMGELVVQRHKEQELRLALREIRSAIDAYKLATEEGRITPSMLQSGYPPSLKTLVDGVVDESSPDKKRKIYFLRRIPRDPMSLEPGITLNEATWGKRSYESSYDAPSEGDDVFDVYSLSTATGMNGIAYKDW